MEMDEGLSRKYQRLNALLKGDLAGSIVQQDSGPVANAALAVDRDHQGVDIDPLPVSPHDVESPQRLDA